MSKISKLQYETLFEFRLALKRFQMFSEEAALAENLSSQQHQLLLALKGFRKKEGLTVKQVAEGLLLKHHSAVELVNRSVKKGIVSRTRSSEDARVVIVEVSQLGEQILERLSTRHLEEIATLKRVLWPILESDQWASRNPKL